MANSVPFDVTRPILYCASAVSAGAYGSGFYLTYPFCYLRNADPDFSGTVGTTCYLVGILAGTTFTPVENYLTSTVPTEEDGLTYMALGTLTSAYQTTLFPEHPLYRFVDGAFKPLSQVAYEASVAIDETRREMGTRFEQTDAAIALKADQTEVNSLSTRVQSAEQKITPQASFLPTTAITMKMEAQPIWFKRHCPCRMIFFLIATADPPFAFLWTSKGRTSMPRKPRRPASTQGSGCITSTWMRAC